MADGQRVGARGYAQRDSSLWKPIVEAIASRLVQQTACHCLGRYFLVLGERGEGWFLRLCRQRQNRPLAGCPGKAGQSTRCFDGKDGRSRRPKGAADKPPPPDDKGLSFSRYSNLKMINLGIYLIFRPCSVPIGIPIRRIVYRWKRAELLRYVSFSRFLVLSPNQVPNPDAQGHDRGSDKERHQKMKQNIP